MSDEPVTHIQLPAPPPVRLSIGAFQIIVLAVAVALTWWITKQNSSPSQGMTETQTAQLEQLTREVTQLRGNLLTQAELEKKVRAEMGADFAKQVAKQNGTLTNLAVAVGKVTGSVVGVIPPALPVTPEGRFTGVTLVQPRTPSLTSVTLDYDPLKPDGLTGKWKMNTEKFTARFGEWRTEHDGIRNAVKFTREVYDGDTKTGEENIPVENGDAYISTDAVNRTVPIAKYTFHVGSSYDNVTGKKRFAGLVGTQITNNQGITTGYVNNAWTVLYSYRFGVGK
jgi:hypothetical protein